MIIARKRKSERERERERERGREREGEIESRICIVDHCECRALYTCIGKS